MHLAEELNIDLFPHHTKAHQDDEKSYDQLSWKQGETKLRL